MPRADQTPEIVTWMHKCPTGGLAYLSRVELEAWHRGFAVALDLADEILRRHDVPGPVRELVRKLEGKATPADISQRMSGP